MVRRIRRLVVEAEPQVERHPARERPRVLPIHAEVFAVIQPLGRRVPRVELEGRAVVEHELVAFLVVRADGPIAIIERAEEVVDPEP